MLHLSLLAASLTILAICRVKAVTLPDGKYQGITLTSSNGVTLPRPLTAFLGLPYAAPPTGQRRFRRPESPIPFSGTKTAGSYGPICRQAPSSAPQDEDCLSLNVFIPEGTSSTAKLPVVIWIPGGAFNSGSGQGLNMGSMVASAPADFVGVSINYRLGALGFLPSNLTARAGLLNLGFFDQAFAIQWVKTNIRLFGGNPHAITLFGESAGAHSIGYHLLHVDPSSPPPFHRVIMDSGSPTSRAFPDFSYPLYQTQTEEFLNQTECWKGEDEVATFDCLRRIDASDIVSASLAVFQKYNPSLRWPFQPVVDYDYISQLAHISWEKGSFNRVPILTGFNSDEGSIFVPRNLNTTDDYTQFFKTLVPTLNQTHMNAIVELYLDPSDPLSPYSNSPFSPQFLRVSAAYGDYAYIAQVQHTAVESAAWNNKVWKYHFAGPVPGVGSALGVPHGSEIGFVDRSSSSKTLSTIMNTYWTSFIVKGDPNALTPDGYTHWPTYTTDAQNQLLFKNTSATVEADAIRRQATNFWRSIPGVLQH